MGKKGEINLMLYSFMQARMKNITCFNIFSEPVWPKSASKGGMCEKGKIYIIHEKSCQTDEITL